jgi:hypothetical protein
VVAIPLDHRAPRPESCHSERRAEEQSDFRQNGCTSNRQDGGMRCAFPP